MNKNVIYWFLIIITFIFIGFAFSLLYKIHSLSPDKITLDGLVATFFIFLGSYLALFSFLGYNNILQIFEKQIEAEVEAKVKAKFETEKEKLTKDIDQKIDKASNFIRKTNAVPLQNLKDDIKKLDKKINKISKTYKNSRNE